MHFNEQLRNQRKSQNISVEDAAERLRLSVTEYLDREADRVQMNVPERCGLLVGLGMRFDQAAKIARELEFYTMGELGSKYAEYVNDPFVHETDDLFIFDIRTSDGAEYEISKQRVKSAEDVLRWIRHLTGKKWVTTEHIRLFTQLAANHLEVTLH